jgi:hypothetical protein
VFVGFGPPIAYTVRLTGIVPESPVKVPLTKTGAQSLRWLAYSMPRGIQLSQLGLESAVTPWSPLNRVRVLPLGSNAWSSYQYDGAVWYEASEPGVPVDPALAPGSAIVLIRFGPPDADDVLELPTWYASPPNLW